MSRRLWLGILLVSVAAGAAVISVITIGKPSLRIDMTKTDLVMSTWWGGNRVGQVSLVIDGGGTFEIKNIEVKDYIIYQILPQITLDSRALPLQVTVMVTTAAPAGYRLVVTVEGIWTYLGMSTSLKLTVTNNITWSFMP